MDVHGSLPNVQPARPGQLLIARRTAYRDALALGGGGAGDGGAGGLGGGLGHDMLRLVLLTDTTVPCSHEGGRKPHMARLLTTLRRLIADMPAGQDRGMLPTNWLLPSSSVRMATMFDHDAGSVPVMLLLCRFRLVSRVSVLQPAGSVELYELD